MTNDDQSADAPSGTPPTTPDPGGPEPGSIEDRLKRFDRWGLIAGGIAAIAVIGLIALLLTSGGKETPAETGLQVTPSGAEAPRLGPIVVSFPEAPATQVAEDLVSIEPAPAGTYAWLDDHTLLFQPDFPGLIRGREYRVTVNGSASGTGEDVVQAFTVEGKLEVRSVIPAPGDAEVPSEARVFVQFSRAVAPLTLLSEAAAGPVVAFDPPLSGQGEWLNTSLYAFTPTDLRPSTTYRATVAAGLTSAADGVLEAFADQMVRKHLGRITHEIDVALKTLLRKQALVAGVTIDPSDLSVSLLDRNGRSIDTQRLSAGERQMMATAVLWGLSRCTGMTLPTVIDTPVGRLDRSHRTNLVERYFPNASRQVVLLSTDEEIVGAHLERLAPHVGARYRLDFDEDKACTSISRGYLDE